MKKFEILLFAVIIVLSSCQTGKKIELDIKNIPSQGVMIEEIMGPDFTLVDSTTIEKNKPFALKVPLSQEKMYRISFEKGKNIMLALKKGDNLKIEGDWNRLEDYVLSGSSSSQAVKEIVNARRQNKIDIRTFKLIIDSLKAREDAVQLERATKESKLNAESYTAYLKSMADSSSSVVASLMAVNLINPVLEAPYVANYYKEVSNRFPANKLVKLYVDNFVGANKLSSAPVNTEKGNPAPNFNAPTPDGKMIHLADYRGKYVLIDFWAAWCGPCRAENPNVVKAYEQFKGKNFDILGVSLDTDKENWKKAIAKDGLAWQQVSELKGWSSSIAQKYRVNSIPANFLVDPDGYIIATGLRGPALMAKLQEVIK